MYRSSVDKNMPPINYFFFPHLTPALLTYRFSYEYKSILKQFSSYTQIANSFLNNVIKIETEKEFFFLKVALHGEAIYRSVECTLLA